MPASNKGLRTAKKKEKGYKFPVLPFACHNADSGECQPGAG